MKRTRRLRQSQNIRDLVHETSLEKSDLIYPMFVTFGENVKREISSMPSIYRYSVDRIDEELQKVVRAGIKTIMLFGIPEHKDELGTGAYDDDGITQRAIRHIKEKYPELVIVADVCLCEYTSHGHCGVVCDGDVLNDETLTLLSKTAVSLTKAGADIVAPSDMMDGRVGAIRKALDENGFINTPIMAYSAKYASAYYGPFRDAADSAPQFGDRKTYQMDFRNSKEAIVECLADIDEGADIVMVKPALAYLDVINEVAHNVNVPLAAYNVSGEYSMVKAAALNGWVDEKRIVTENLTAIKRAGAKIIITYYALEVAKWLDE